MAKPATELNRKVLQNLRTSGSVEHIESQLSGIAAMGEIIVQTTEPASGTSLWTLAKDGETAVQFVNKETVEQMIYSGASEGLKELSASVISAVTIIEGQIQDLDDKTFSAETALAEAIQQEINRATSAETALAEAIQQEINRATSAETELAYSIEREVIRALSAETALGEQIEDETQRAMSAETMLKYDIDTLADATELELIDVNERIDELAKKAVKNEDHSINVVLDSTSSSTLISVNIKEGEKVIQLGENGIYTDIKISALTEEEIEELPDHTNIRDAYKLLDSTGGTLGDIIKIYKDSSLYNVYLGHVDDRLETPTSPVIIPGSGDTALCFIYYKSDNTYELVAVDIEEFLEENEFKDGLEVTNHEVRVKIDEQSDPYLTVSLDGVKLSGVTEAISGVTWLIDQETQRAISAETMIINEIENITSAQTDHYQELLEKIQDLDDKTFSAETELAYSIEREVMRALSAETALGEQIEDETQRAMSAETMLKYDIDTLADATELELIDVNERIDNIESAVTVDIANIKRRLDKLEAETTVGEDTDFADITVTEESGVTTIKVDVKTQDIATASGDTDGLATAFNVKGFALSDIKDNSTYEKINVSVVTEDGVRKLDFTNLVVDCGEF